VAEPPATSTRRSSPGDRCGALRLRDGARYTAGTGFYLATGDIYATEQLLGRADVSTTANILGDVFGSPLYWGAVAALARAFGVVDFLTFDRRIQSSVSASSSIDVHLVAPAVGIVSRVFLSAPPYALVASRGRVSFAA
jgi:hypothetical protein